MLGNLVWLFRQHRELQAFTDRLAARNAELERVCYELEKRLGSPEHMIESYYATAFKEEPFPDDEIPEHFYLSPPSSK